MISRRRKITTAGLVLAIGFAIAWPFRRSGEVQPETNIATGSPTKGPELLPLEPGPTPPSRMSHLPGPVALSPIPESKQERFPATMPVGGLPSTLASTLVPSEPALVAEVGPTPMVATPVAEIAMPGVQSTPSLPHGVELSNLDGKRPIYSTAMLPASVTAQAIDQAERIEAEGGIKPATDDLRIHVVHNGDTLQRLAARYLDDERRAMEIFDLNRGTLTNPHLLPIGVEIVIPAKRQTK